ncbi:MAG TPA: triose-phosphate isomerase, partial [Candidatus Limnocylindrales bacterium]
MNTTPLDAALLANDIAAATEVEGVIRVICPPFVCLQAVSSALQDTSVSVGVQNIHAEPFGAYTGEISAPMIAGLASWAIIGHSERRRDQGEDDQLVGRKLLRCAEFGLRPILCVGEQIEERKAGKAEETVRRQLERTLAEIGRASAELPADLVIAYEPVWAIGTGLAARGSDASAMAQVIR